MQIRNVRTLAILAVIAGAAISGCGNDTILGPDSPAGADLSTTAAPGRVRQERIYRNVSAMDNDQLARIAPCSGFSIEPPSVSPEASLSELVTYTNEMIAWRAQFLTYVNGLSLGEVVELSNCIANPPDHAASPDVNAYSAVQLAFLADCAGYEGPPVVNSNASLSELVSQTQAYTAWRAGFVTYVTALPLGRLVEYTNCAKAREQVTQA